MNERSRLGHEGEQEAIYHLMLRGYTLLEHNWRSSHYEIDIIAEYWGQIVFVEVKTRRDEHFAPAAEAVTLHKKRNIIAAGRAYLAHNHLLGSPYSYDIITVVGKQRPFCITHLRHAYNEETVWKQRLHKRDFEV